MILHLERNIKRVEQLLEEKAKMMLTRFMVYIVLGAVGTPMKATVNNKGCDMHTAYSMLYNRAK